MNQLTSTTPDTTAVVPCPRCQKPLIDPNGLGWCKACGYCQSLNDSEQKADKPAKAAAPNTLTATSSAVVQTPTWIWVTLIGLIAVGGASYALGNYLTMTPFQRALLCTLQIVGGFGVMFIGQFIGLLRIAPEESALSFWDAVFPFRLYGLILKRLPSTRYTIYLGAWGFAAIVSAAVLIGGLGHWYTSLPGYQKNQMKKNKK